MLTADPLATTDLDGLALKPAECDPGRVADLDVGTVTVDFEGRDHQPDRGTLLALADRIPSVRVTVPVRADGYDPLGEDARWRALPDAVGAVLVAGHPAYLDAAERDRAVAPRLGAARERAPDAWVGTEGIERVALAAGGTQFELLSPETEAVARALDAAGHDGDLAVYAPVVLADDEDAALDAVGRYAARREPVRAALPADAATDSGAGGRAREVLSAAVAEYALVGTGAEVRRRVASLRDAGVDVVVGYPARGLDAFLGGR